MSLKLGTCARIKYGRIFTGAIPVMIPEFIHNNVTVYSIAIQHDGHARHTNLIWAPEKNNIFSARKYIYSYDHLCEIVNKAFSYLCYDFDDVPKLYFDYDLNLFYLDIPKLYSERDIFICCNEEFDALFKFESARIGDTYIISDEHNLNYQRESTLRDMSPVNNLLLSIDDGIYARDSCCHFTKNINYEITRDNYVVISNDEFVDVYIDEEKVAHNGIHYNLYWTDLCGAAHQISFEKSTVVLEIST